MSNKGMFQQLQDNFVLLSKEEEEDLRRRAKGANNLNLHLQEKDLLLRKEKERSKKLEKQLIVVHKRLNDLTLHQQEEKDCPLTKKVTDISENLFCSVGSKSKAYSKSSDSDLTTDNSIIVQDGSTDTSSLSMVSLERDGEVSNVSNVCPDLPQHPMLDTDNGKQSDFKLKHKDRSSPKVFNFEFSELSMSQKISTQSIGENDSLMDKENIKPHESNGGVSEKYFDKLKQELIRVKQQLNQLLREKQVNLKEFETHRHYKQTVEDLTEQVSKLTTERDEERNHTRSLNGDLLMYKNLVKKQKEGVTFHYDQVTSSVHCSDENSRHSSQSVTPQSSIQDGSDAGCVISASRDKVTATCDKQTSPMDPVVSPDMQQVLKDMQNKILKLEAQLREAIAARDKYRVDAREVSRNYEQLIKDLERPNEESKLRKQKQDLEDENFELKRKLSESKEEFQEVLSNIEVIQNNLSKEKEKNLKLEAMLREEQRCHGLTKHNLYVMYGNLKTKYDRLFHEKNRLQQKLAIGSGERTLSNSSSDSGGIMSNPEEIAREYTPLNLPTSSQTSTSSRDFGIVESGNLASCGHVDTFGRLPVESNHEFSEYAAGINGGKSSGSEIKLFQCERCYAEFRVEMKYLKHIEKCLDD